MIKVSSLTKSFGEPPLQILHGLDFEIADGSFVSITGRSGSGKSTLLYCISTLDEPTSGQVYFDGRDLAQMTSKELHRFRNLEMGFVFQFHYLLPELTAIENVLIPARKAQQESEREARGYQLLENFGLKGKEHKLPKHLSGGEQQRVAIARALVMQPKYVFADEPTGNLDSANGDVVMKILKQITQDGKTTVIYVTHDPDYAEQATQKIQLVDGKIVLDERTSK